jgi:hypothetical protein
MWVQQTCCEMHISLIKLYLKNVLGQFYFSSLSHWPFTEKTNSTVLLSIFGVASIKSNSSTFSPEQGFSELENEVLITIEYY